MIFLNRFFLASLALILTITLSFNAPVLAVSEQNSSTIFNSALDQTREQNYQQALIDFTQVIDRQDNLVGAAYSNRCLVNLQLQNYVAAEADCVKAIEYNANNTEAYLNLGLAYFRNAKYNQAIEKYQEVIKRDRDDYRAYYNQGLAHFALQDYHQAILDYNSALMSPCLVDAEAKTLIYNDRGLTYTMLKQYKRAIANFEQTITLENNNYTAYFNRGCVHHCLGNYVAAIEDFTQVIKFKSDWTQAYVNRSVLYHHLGNERAAFNDIQIALKQYQSEGNVLSYQKVLELKKTMVQSRTIQIG